MVDQHTAKAFDVDLQDLARMVAEMGGLAEKQIAESVDALARRDARLAQRVVALDPIATAKIEELIYELKELYTIVIVTHNMQQAARVSEFTAFFMLGRLVEYDRTDKIFTNPAQKITEDYITGRFG